MLKNLSIKNIVLIDQLHLSLDSGLTTMTGETGAGKSILLDSIGLAIGQRAETRLIRQGSDSAVVTASFDLAPDHPAIEILKENHHSITQNTPLIIRRIIQQNGQNKIFLNDEPISASLLKKIGATLSDIHGQFDTHNLMDEKNHLKMVDQFADLHQQCQGVAASWYQWKETEKTLKQTKEQALHAKQEEDYLRHVLSELREINPKPGEEEELEKERLAIRRNKQSIDAFNIINQVLGDDDGADMKLGQAIRALEKIIDLDSNKLNPILDGLSRAQNELSDTLFAIQDYQGNKENNDQNLDKIEERLLDIKDMARKHRCLPAELPEKMQEIIDKIDLIENLDAKLSELKNKEKEHKKIYSEQALALSNERKKAAIQIDKSVMQELPPMKMEKAIFQTFITQMDEKKWGADGIDHVSFLVTTNPGSAPGPLNKIASGGELSRIMLALKLVLSTTDLVTTLVFDEVDAGIGGSTADAVGERLARLAQNGKQVLVVTHSPQVAAKGNHHLRIVKATDHNITTTSIMTLNQEERQEEIARMLAGATVTEEARLAAKKLLAISFSHKQKISA